ncbi:MAG: hypothetical protein B7Z80_15580 [Rhodospirillales bacterium 20-64-7]|nr:MAG: hypothetical protein B7Z80_15580 [Rhodospirillales bacterium 20-64-7]
MRGEIVLWVVRQNVGERRGGFQAQTIIEKQACQASFIFEAGDLIRCRRQGALRDILRRCRVAQGEADFFGIKAVS